MPDEPQFQEGAFRGGAADEPHRVDEREQREADDPHLVAHVHGLPGHGRAHDRGPRRPEARARVHLRADGRPQAGRVRADPDLPRPFRRPQDRGEEAPVSTVERPREVRAQAKYVRMSPRKARLVAEHIRGRSVPEARAVLAFTSRKEEGDDCLMGQKVHPGGMRVGVIHDWKSNWYTGKKEFPGYLIEDIKIREHITNKLSHAGLSDILIRKDKQRVTVDIYTARPGIVIGKSGVEVDALRKELHAITKKNVHININEIKRPELDAKLVAQGRP